MHLQGNLGTAALVNGDAESARRAFSEQLHLCRELVNEPAAYLALYGFAAVAAARDDLDRAAYLYGAAAVGRVPDDRIDARADELFAPARRRHGARTWDAAVRQGRALSLQDAIAYALGEQDAPGADHATQRSSVADQSR